MNGIAAWGLVALTLVGSSAALADDVSDKAAVAKQIGAAKITLQQGLTAGEAQGQVISGNLRSTRASFSSRCTPPKARRFKK